MSRQLVCTVISWLLCCGPSAAAELIDLEELTSATESTATTYDLTDDQDWTVMPTAFGRPINRDGSGPWSVNFTQTVDYITNLALPFALTPNNGSVFQNDFGFQTTGGFRYTRTFGEFFTAYAGYSYYQNLHPNVTSLNLQTHSPVGGVSVQLTERVVAAMDYDWSYYYLAGNSLVGQNRVANSFTYTGDNLWIGKIAYDLALADFKGNQQFLDSNNHSARLEMLRYFSDRRAGYLTGGYTYGLSNAALDGFAYHVNSVFLGTLIPLGQARRTNLNLLGAYGQYDFHGFDPIETTVIREDRILSLSARLSRNITDRMQLFGQFIYYDSDSNVLRQDYVSKTFSGGVTVGF